MESKRISHYEVGRLLGRGGMGEVYEAVDLDLDRRVALKFVAPELSADGESLRRFEREARAAAALNHPHIATLYAFERASGRPFIAMELVGGESLRDRIRRGPMPIPESLAIARDVAAALALAHKRGIAHRDVKPENLMFDEDGVVKVMDFGLARAIQASRITVSGSTLGTAAYMPPESVRGETGPPADVFALGVVLHEMLTGDLPFAGESPLALLYTIANDDPKSVKAARPEVSDAVEQLIARMLVKDPAARVDAPTVARELGALTGAAFTPAADDTVELEPEIAPRAPEPALVPTPGPTPRRRRVLPWLAVPGALIVLWVLATKLDMPWIGAGPGGRQEAINLNNEGITALATDVPRARTLFEAAHKRDPAYGEAMINLGVVALRDSDENRAAQWFGEVLRRHGSEPALAAVAHDHLAEIDMRARAWASAVDHETLALTLDSTSVPNYYNNLAYALIQSGRTDDATLVLRRGLKHFPSVPALYKNAALVHFVRGEYMVAIGLLNQGLAIDRTFAPAWALRARAYAWLGKLREAKDDRDRFASMAPAAADLAEVDGDIAEAARHPGGVHN